MRFFMPVLLSLFLITSPVSAEPVPGDSCTRYPENAVMRSGGPELGGKVYVMTCKSGIWSESAINPPDPCPGAVVGGICPDGTIYAGLTPDGDVRMFMAAEDAPTTLQWAPDPEDLPGLEDCVHRTPPPPLGTGCYTGAYNSAMIAAQGENYAAAYYCENLDAHGYTDWYLPALMELSLLNGIHPVAGLQGARYWSSSQPSVAGGEDRAYRVWMPGGNALPAEAISNKNRVRCVRKE